jgi:uncharacterized protein (TIGR03000 family)
MRRILGFALLSCALVVVTADVASARGCRGGGCSSCYSGCSTCSTGTCANGVCVVASAATTAGEAASTILVQLPADALLTIDGKATTSTSSVRSFRTPSLPTGHTYTYTMEARMNNGEVVTQQVNFRAGEQTLVRFAMPTATVAQR